MKNNFYIYLYLDPRREGRFKYENFSLLYEPFYVGKGKDYRYNKFDKRNDFCENKINKIKSLDFEPIIFKMKENLFENEAFDLEIELIEKIGRYNLGKGPLTNLTDGGEGISGYKWTEEQSKERRKDFSEIKQAFEDKDYTLYTKEEEYINNTTKLKYKHNPCGIEHEISWGHFKQGTGCPICAKCKIYFYDIIKAFEDKDYTLYTKEEEYINNTTKLKYKHNPCGIEHEISWHSFNNGCGCPICGTKNGHDKEKVDWDLIEKTFTDKGYELKSKKEEYINCDTKLKYKHKKCGTEHEISWTNFQQDHGCPICGNKEQHEKQRKNFDEIIKLFEHFNFILLTKKEDYKNARTKLEYITSDGEIRITNWVNMCNKLRRQNKNVN